jgi:chromosome segregation ATPase
MTVKPVEAVAQDAAKLLGDAVAKVAAEAIDPKLEPFQRGLATVTGELKTWAQALEQTAAEQDTELGNLNSHFAEVRTAAAQQREAAARHQAAVDEAVREVGKIGGDLSSAVQDAAAQQAEAAARQQAAVDEAVRAVGKIGGDLASATRDAAAKQVQAAAGQQAAVDEAVRAVAEIGGDLTSATRDLAGLTRQFTNLRRLLVASIVIGVLALAAGVAGLLLALG